MTHGVMNVRREIVSGEVVSYAQHVPNEEIKLNKVENMVYKNGALSSADGSVYCKLMTEVKELKLYLSRTSHVNIGFVNQAYLVIVVY